jgi:hypothetical protein
MAREVDAMPSKFLISGPPFHRWHKWIKKKRKQVWKRQHLSATLSLLLAVLVVGREAFALQEELPGLRQNCSELAKNWGKLTSGAQTSPNLQPEGESSQELIGDVVAFLSSALRVLRQLLFWLFILALVTGTLVAAFWERSPTKLATSPQEVGFVSAMRSLLLELESMLFAGKISKEQAQKKFDEFMKGFLRFTSKTICAHRKVDAGFLVKHPGEILKRNYISDTACFPIGFELPIPRNIAEESRRGPGALSCFRGKLVYTPSVKKYKEAWVISMNKADGEYALDGQPVTSWVKAAKPEEEDFSSLLCLPVGLDENGQTRYGVLELSTKAKDEFIDRDFLMAECFASILTLAAGITAAASSTSPPEEKDRSVVKGQSH